MIYELNSADKSEKGMVKGDYILISFKTNLQAIVISRAEKNLINLYSALGVRKS